MIQPPGVPAAAFWDAAAEEWRVGESAPRTAGERDEALPPRVREQTWWPNGVPKTMVARAPGRGIDAAFRFHPDGSMYRLGALIDGVPHGTHRAYRTDNPTPESLQPCCVPPGAWQLVQTFERGQGGETRWFNRSGIRILGSGETFPERPASVPGDARFNEHAKMWEGGISFMTATPSGTRRRWDPTGTLRSEEELREGKADGATRIYDEAGQLLQETHYAAGVAEGPFCEPRVAVPLFGRADVAGYAGQFHQGQAVGLWRYFAADGREICTRDLGRAVTHPFTPDTSAALADVRRTADEWLALAQSLEVEGRQPEAILAAARATAECDSVSILRQALDRLTMPLEESQAQAHAERAGEDAGGELVPLVDALRRGAAPAILLRQIARNLVRADRAALDFASASCLLDPTSMDALTTRALTLGALGDVVGARRDLESLRPRSEDRAQFLDLYLRIYFPRFEFWPAAERFELGENDSPLPPLYPARDVAAVREVIARLATRLMWLRRQVRAQLSDDPPFLPPDLGALLPDGPATLRRWTYSMSAAEYAGEEAGAGEPPQQASGDDLGQAPSQETSHDDGQDTVDITVDESLGLPAALPRPTLLSLMRRARGDWAALTWLCWSAGLDRPGLPEALNPPATFYRAAVMAMERTWRCHDKLVSSGMVALTRGIPGFDWSGTSIDLVPAVLAEVALEEYLEVRAIFSWLCDPANQSPWQDDLRQLK
jgi:hypothetical protein